LKTSVNTHKTTKRLESANMNDIEIQLKTAQETICYQKAIIEAQLASMALQNSIIKYYELTLSNLLGLDSDDLTAMLAKAEKDDTAEELETVNSELLETADN
jgi:hypothetical protein